MKRLPTRVALVAALALQTGTALSEANPNSILRVSFQTAETGFDPQAASDASSVSVCRVIFDALYRYDHLARPHKLVPNTAAALPEISADGRTWTIRIKPGIYFADDPVFKGEKRELTAADYVYAWKRALDPAVRSYALQVFDGRFVGADAIAAKARETHRLDYDAPMEGLQAIDRYTIRMKLNFPDAELLSNLTTPPSAAVAREVLETYHDDSGWVMANPVGTGPYRLEEWRRGQRIVLRRNPGFREVTYPESDDPDDRAIMSKLRGARIPRIGRIEISIIEESSPRLLSFQRRDLDYVTVPADLAGDVLDPAGEVRPELAQQHIALYRGIQPVVVYTYFNMEDPIVGGYTPEKIALRRAIGLAYNVPEEIRVIRQGQAIPATQVIPPPVSGHDPKLDERTRYDPAAARALLDRFGYKDRDGDGWRDLPDGKPLVLNISSSSTAADHQLDELWKKSMEAIGIRVNFVKGSFADLLKAARYGQLQMFRHGNGVITPEGFDLLGLLYGGHAGFSNLARFRLPGYDRLYEKARSMPDEPGRTRVMRDMSELVNAYAPWLITVYRYENVLVQPWVIGYKYDAFDLHPWPYLDIDEAQRRGGSANRSAH